MTMFARHSSGNAAMTARPRSRGPTIQRRARRRIATQAATKRGHGRIRSGASRTRNAGE
jgi:hypothetical protein